MTVDAVARRSRRSLRRLDRLHTYMTFCNNSYRRAYRRRNAAAVADAIGMTVPTQQQWHHVTMDDASHFLLVYIAICHCAASSFLYFDMLT